MIPFGKQLHTTRNALGMTQDDLALAVNVDKQTISNWECERTQPWPNKKVEVLTKLIELQRQTHLTYSTGQYEQQRQRVIDRI